ncbi:MAG: DUF4058 family protein [Planctomycetes bacterium]|nr:DUF4058 family protein [Planctomycetota bacterium]
MPSPFPGMDPYLEDPSLFAGFHEGLAVEMRRRLNSLLPRPYAADVGYRLVTDSMDDEEVRVFLPDVAVPREPASPLREERSAAGTGSRTAPVSLLMPLPVPAKQCYVEVRSLAPERLVTAIEIVSRSNKRPGSEDQEAFARKRLRYLASTIHYLEIDLLRDGERWPAAADEPRAAYRVLLSRADRRPRGEVWPIHLPDPLPELPVPLLRPDADAILPLAACMASVYEDSAYSRRIDYRRPVPRPPLEEEAQRFVDRLLAR